MAEDVVLEAAMSPGPVRGRGQAIAFYTNNVRKAFPDQAVELRRLGVLPADPSEADDIDRNRSKPPYQREADWHRQGTATNAHRHPVRDAKSVGRRALRCSAGLLDST